jgi:hypothetical protein
MGDKVFAKMVSKNHWVTRIGMTLLSTVLTRHVLANSFPAADFALGQGMGGTRQIAKDGRRNLAELGLDAHLRCYWFTAGLGADWRTTLLSSVWGARVAAGVALPVWLFRLELLGVYGWHHYPGWGADVILGSDPGVTTGLPYFGWRIRALYEVQASSRMGFLVGSYFDYDDDVRRKHVSYTYTETHWLFDNNTVEVGEHQDVGAKSYSVGVTGVVTFPVF